MRSPRAADTAASRSRIGRDPAVVRVMPPVTLDRRGGCGLTIGIRMCGRVRWPGFRVRSASPQAGIRHKSARGAGRVVADDQCSGQVAPDHLTWWRAGVPMRARGYDHPVHLCPGLARAGVREGRAQATPASIAVLLRRGAGAVAAGRVALGLTALAWPSLPARPWVGAAADDL